MKKLLLFVLVLSFGFIVSCSQDDAISEFSNQEKENYRKETISFKEFLISEKNNTEIQKLNKYLPEQSQKNNSSINDWEIDTTKVVKITTNNLTTYTFSIKEKSKIEGFRNIIVKKENNQTTNYIVHYPNGVDFEGKSSRQVTINKLDSNLFNKSIECFEVVIETVSGCSSGTCEWGWYLKQVDCNTQDSGGGSEGSDGGGSTPGGTNPGGGSPGGNPGGGGIVPPDGLPTDPIGGGGGGGSSYSINTLRLATYIELNNIEKQWLTENPSITDILLQLLDINNYSIQSKNEIKWAVSYLTDNSNAGIYFSQNPKDLPILFSLGTDFFTQNLNISWDYLENWFFKKQLETESHPVINPDLITFDTPIQQASLPSFNTFLSNFPKNGTYPNYTELLTSDAYKLAGGSLWDSHLNQREAYNNACAIRGSRGLLYSGFDIPVLRYNGTQRTQKGGDGKNYILDAVSFNKFMIQKFGDTPHKLEGADANDPKKVADLLKNKNGIYVIINDKYPSQIHYSGHVDTIINGKCIGGAYTTPNGGVKSIRIWVLN